MTNINNPIGAKIIGAIQNAEFNPNRARYIIPSTDSVDLFINDFVKTNGTSINGIPVVVKAAAGDVLRGIVIDFDRSHDYENITYREANTERIVYVNHAPSVEFEIQASGILIEADVGKNFNILVNGGNKITGLSGTQLDTSTATSLTAQLKLISIIENPINELGAYTKVRAMILEHELAPTSTPGTLPHNTLLNLAFDVAGHGLGKTGFQRGTTNAIIPPTVNDDNTQGYRPGDLWLDTNTDFGYFCADASTGAAIWEQILTDSQENLWDRELISGSDYRLNPHKDINDRVNTNTAYQINKVDVLSTKGTHNTCIGEGSDGSLTTGQDNLFAGYNAGANTTTGSFNCYVGFESGKTGTTAQYNLGLGYKTLTAITNASNNTAIGNQAGAAITSGGYNVFVGATAAVQTTTASGVIAIGRDAGRINNADHLIAIGYYAARNTITGTGNIYIGKEAGTVATSNNNTIIGYESAKVLTSGGNNTLCGYQTGIALTTETGNIHIGHQAGSQSTDSNKLFIDNSNTTTPLIGGDFSTNTLNFRGIASYYSHPTFSADEQLVDKKFVDDHPGATVLKYDDLSSQIISGGETSFTISTIPLIPGESRLYRNGIKQYYGTSPKDFTISGTTLTFNHTDLIIGEVFEVYYEYKI